MFGNNSPGPNDGSRFPFAGFVQAPDLATWQTSVSPAYKGPIERAVAAQIAAMRGITPTVRNARR